MSFLIDSYRRGLYNLVAGVAMVAFGVVASAHLVLLAGIAMLAWGGYRFCTFRAHR
jgi:hypothetical protein